MSDIKIGKITLGVCQTNTYFIYREGSSDIIVFDPADRGEYLFSKFQEKGFNVAAILLTHGHFDHILGIEDLQKHTDVKLYASEDEAELAKDIELNCSQMFRRECSVNPDILFSDGEKVTLADIELEVIKTPGHTVGGCCYYIEEAGFLISGDTLFLESVGRTDLPTGSMGTLIRSIKEKLFILPDETIVYPGHGPSTTIEHEKEYNPFI
ncbi:MAG: MBL fold metallo-hydrolase [Lachnospiraceae bacterium]|nr:MBL fold metallo-hydrolase [Lachnospiraceae bacterium]